MNGRVHPILSHNGQFVGPDRTWLQDQDTPGLAMSRSIGDEIAHSVGVSENPEVFRFDLKFEDKFIVIASDGVWEFMTAEEVGQIVWPFYQKNSPEQAGNAIVRAAAKKWRKFDSTIDDITCITIFLEIDHVVPSSASIQNPLAPFFKSNTGILNPSRPTPYPMPTFVKYQ